MLRGAARRPPDTVKLLCCLHRLRLVEGADTIGHEVTKAMASPFRAVCAQAFEQTEMAVSDPILRCSRSSKPSQWNGVRTPTRSKTPKPLRASSPEDWPIRRQAATPPVASLRGDVDGPANGLARPRQLGQLWGVVSRLGQQREGSTRVHRLERRPVADERALAPAPAPAAARSVSRSRVGVPASVASSTMTSGPLRKAARPWSCSWSHFAVLSQATPKVLGEDVRGDGRRGESDDSVVAVDKRPGGAKCAHSRRLAC